MVRAAKALLVQSDPQRQTPEECARTGPVTGLAQASNERDRTKCPETARKASSKLDTTPKREPGPDCRPHPLETRGPHHVGNRDPPPLAPKAWIVGIGLRLFQAAAPNGPFMHSPTEPKPPAEYFRAKAVECLERSLRVPDPEYQRLYCELAAQWFVLAHEAESDEQQ